MKETFWGTIKEIFVTGLISFAIYLFVSIFLVQPHRVKGESMLPNFRDGELLLTEKVTYRLNKPKRGDVIVFHPPESLGSLKVIISDLSYIKRIIGLPGENVKIEGGTVYINGQRLTEYYIGVPTGGTMNVDLLPNQYIVLGDNRGASSDSRVFGPIKDSEIVGRVWIVYWPIFRSTRANGARVVSGANYGIPDAFNNSR